MIRVDSLAHIFFSQGTVPNFFKEDREHLTYFHLLHVHRQPILTKTTLTLNPPRYPYWKRGTECHCHNFQPKQLITGQVHRAQAPGGRISLGQRSETAFFA